ncbi:hypothetical protein GJ496_009150 [Pomphorhynchus laevis]|nr:hypothetical protein GJ496_009150 [Pomphorhynchus laevis]
MIKNVDKVRLFLKFSYCGTRFRGCQYQEVGTATVASAIEYCLGKLLLTTDFPKLTLSSRTDTGVHAIQSTASFMWPTLMSDNGNLNILKKQMNQWLYTNDLDIRFANGCSTFNDHILKQPTFSEFVLVNTLEPVSDRYSKTLVTFNTSDNEIYWSIESFDLTQEIVICLKSPFSEKCQSIDIQHPFLRNQERLAFLSIKSKSKYEYMNGQIDLYINCVKIKSIILPDWMDEFFRMHRHVNPRSNSLIYFDLPVMHVMKKFGCMYMNRAASKSPEKPVITGFNSTAYSYLTTIMRTVQMIDRRLVRTIKYFLPKTHKIPVSLENQRNVTQRNVTQRNVTQRNVTHTVDEFVNVSGGDVPCQIRVGSDVKFVTKCIYRTNRHKVDDDEVQRWTVIMHREITRDVNEIESFNKSWVDYKHGFGSVNGNLWLGLKNLNEITSQRNLRLRVEAKYGQNFTDIIEFNGLSVGLENDSFPLTISNPSDSEFINYSLYYHNGMKFTTLDKDNDLSSENCAQLSGGGWWFRNCATFLPTGRLYALWNIDLDGGQSFYDTVTLMVDY